MLNSSILVDIGGTDKKFVCGKCPPMLHTSNYAVIQIPENMSIEQEIKGLFRRKGTNWLVWVFRVQIGYELVVTFWQNSGFAAKTNDTTPLEIYECDK